MMRRALRLARRALSASAFALPGLAGATLVALGVFRDLGAARGTASTVAAVAVFVLGGMLVARIAARLGNLRRATAAPAVSTPIRGEWKRDFELGALLLASAFAAFQATGGARSLLHPLAYALVAFLVTLQRKAVGLPLVAFAMVLEGALFFAAGVPANHAARALVSTPSSTALLGSHLAFLSFFALLHLVVLQAEVMRQRLAHRARLAGEVLRLRDEARDFRLIATPLTADSRGRTREEEEEIIAAASVENIHQALFYNLELLKKSLDLHTAVLLWLDDSGQVLRIKELSTDSDAIAAGPFGADAGLLGAIVKDRLPVRLESPRPEHLPYYDGAQPIGAFAGVPVIEDSDPRSSPRESAQEADRAAAENLGGRPAAIAGARPGYLRGVLCVDRLVTRGTEGVPAAIPFDERDQALLEGAAREILRAISAERIFVAVERGKHDHERFFRASDLLNRALTPEQVYDTAFRAARELCDFDFACIALVDKTARRHTVVASIGDGAEEVAGLSFSDNAGLVAMAVKNRHPLPATGERRDKDQPVFTKKVKLRGMESLLILPLIAAGEAIGSFTLAARATRRFGKDKRERLGVIANQVAVSTKNAEMYAAMEEMATTDGLTGLVNHRTFQERFADLLSRAERQSQRVTLLLTDIDHFKKVNDTYGHPVGDIVLKGVAGVCRDQVRKIDVAARYGGEEFAIVLDGTDREGARQLAERIRKEVAAQQFSSDKGEFGCTLSLGIATYPEDGKDPKTLIAHADQSLYFAKHNGRNRAVAWADVQAAESPGADKPAPPLRAVR